MSAPFLWRWFPSALVLASALAAATPARAQDDEPPPWESGATEAPPWESGLPPTPEEQAPPPEGKQEQGPEVELPPPGEDTEKPYLSRTREMEETPVDELGIDHREEDGVERTVIPFDPRGPVAYGGVGYEAGADSGHLMLSAAAGWAVWGHMEALRAEGQVPEIEGTATQILLSLDVAPKLAQDVVPSFLTIGVRAQQVAMFGRHMLTAQLGLGGRKDLGTELGGVDLSFGLAYAYAIKPPFAIPVQIELVRHYSGTFVGRVWAFRISVSWPLWFHF